MSSPKAKLADWLARYETVTSQGIELGLDRVGDVFARLNPRRAQHVLTVAGTNGKGSSVAMLAALLRDAGYRVGAYTSPHLMRYNERIAIDGLPASDDEIVRAFERIEAARGDTRLTYFEVGTLAAVEVFAAREVDVAVLEVGLGGRLDAVNVVEPDVSLITSIALDHQEWLGDTREAIAVEKAGIMRSGKPAVYAEIDRPASIDAAAAEIGARLYAAGRDYCWQTGERGDWSYTGMVLQFHDLAAPALYGEFQRANAAGVLCTLEAAGLGEVLILERINRILSTIEVPGRSQRFSDRHRWLFDVAHNPAAAEGLAATLESVPRRHRVAIVGMLDDKDTSAVIGPLLPFIDDWIAVSASNPRAVPAAELGRRVASLSNRPCLIAESPAHAVAEARRRSGDRSAEEKSEIVVFGSFYTVGPVQHALGL